MEFFDENGDGMMSVCSLEEGHTSPADMLAAVKPYAGPGEQEIIDLLMNVASFKAVSYTHLDVYKRQHLRYRRRQDPRTYSWWFLPVW